MGGGGLAPGACVEVDITALDDAGHGVGICSGTRVHVAGALPDERVRARVRAVGRAGAFADCDAVLAAAADRVVPRCSVFGRCGGCELQHLAYPAQRRAKQWRVTRALARAGLAGTSVLPTIGAADPWGQRAKAQWPAATAADGSLVLGLYARRSHDVIPLTACPVQHPLAERALAAVPALAPDHGLTAWSGAAGAPGLRHVLVRVAPGSERALLVCVTATSAWPQGPAFARALRARCPFLAGVWQNVNPDPGNRVLGADTRLLDGADDLVEPRHGVGLPVAPAAFFQVAPGPAAHVDAAVVRAAGLARTPDALVIDAFAGTGALAFACAGAGARVHAIERDAGAVAAGRAAVADRPERISWRAADAAAGLQACAAEGRHPHAVVLDPPRAGNGPAVLAAAQALAPAVLVLVACRPESLARDLGRLAADGWRCDRVQPVDLFPHTLHVECVARVRPTRRARRRAGR